MNITTEPSDDPVPGDGPGPNTSVLSQDERSATFVLRVTNPDGGAFWIVFTDLPETAFGVIRDHPGAAVALGTHYDPQTEEFTFDPVEIEPQCDPFPVVLQDCFTNGSVNSAPPPHPEPRDRQR